MCQQSQRWKCLSKTQNANNFHLNLPFPEHVQSIWYSHWQQIKTFDPHLVFLIHFNEFLKWYSSVSICRHLISPFHMATLFGNEQWVASHSPQYNFTSSGRRWENKITFIVGLFCNISVSRSNSSIAEGKAVRVQCFHCTWQTLTFAFRAHSSVLARQLNFTGLLCKHCSFSHFERVTQKWLSPWELLPDSAVSL